MKIGVVVRLLISGSLSVRSNWTRCSHEAANGRLLGSDLTNKADKVVETFGAAESSVTGEKVVIQLAR